MEFIQKYVLQPRCARGLLDEEDEFIPKEIVKNIHNGDYLQI